MKANGLASVLRRGAPALLLLTAAAAPPVVTHPWARATAPHQTTAAVYLDITAPTDTALIAATSPDAAGAMLHQTTRMGSMSSMADMNSLTLHANQTAHLAPGSMHIMLTGLSHPLTAGGTVPVTLVFAGGEQLAVQVPVQPIGALGPPQDGAR